MSFVNSNLGYRLQCVGGRDKILVFAENIYFPFRLKIQLSQILLLITPTVKGQELVQCFVIQIHVQNEQMNIQDLLSGTTTFVLNALYMRHTNIFLCIRSFLPKLFFDQLHTSENLIPKLSKPFIWRCSILNNKCRVVPASEERLPGFQEFQDQF